MQNTSRRLQQFLMALIGAAVLSACDGKSNAYVAPPPPKVHIAQPLRKSVTQYFELTGNTAAINSVDIQARVEGFLDAINYQDGASVTKGTPLFTIQSNTYQAQLDQAKANITKQEALQVNAQQEYDRQVRLNLQGASTKTSLDQQKANLDQANASILDAKASADLAQINLGYTSVAAPFDGTVTAHLVDVGALVGVSGPTKLASIVQTDPLYVNFNVSEAQVLTIKVEMAKQGRTLRQIDLATIPVEIGLQGETGYPHQGHLDYVSPQVDASTGTLAVRAVFDNKDRALLAGLFVRVRVPIGHLDNALLVRDDSIGANQQGSYVLVLGKDNTVEQKTVKTGQRDGPFRVVETGLNPDDWVVTEGIQQAIPGAKVDPEKKAMDDSGADTVADTAPKSSTP